MVLHRTHFWCVDVWVWMWMCVCHAVVRGRCVMLGLCVLVRDVVCAVVCSVQCLVCSVQYAVCGVCSVWCVCVMLCVECAIVYLGMYVGDVSLCSPPNFETHQTSLYTFTTRIPLIRRPCLFDNPRTTHSFHPSIHPGEVIRWFRSHSKSLTR